MHCLHRPAWSPDQHERALVQMRIYLEPFHAPNAVPCPDKAAATLSWRSSTAWIHQQHPARLRSQGCPCSPTFHISFPRANPPQKRFNTTASRSQPSFAHNGRHTPVGFQEHWAQPWADQVPIPSETQVLNRTSTWICRSTHTCYCGNGSSVSNFTQYRRNPKWENCFVTLSCQNWTCLGVGWDQKGMDFYSYSFIWQYRSLKCNWI